MIMEQLKLKPLPTWNAGPASSCFTCYTFHTVLRLSPQAVPWVQIRDMLMYCSPTGSQCPFLSLDFLMLILYQFCTKIILLNNLIYEVIRLPHKWHQNILSYFEELFSRNLRLLSKKLLSFAHKPKINCNPLCHHPSSLKGDNIIGQRGHWKRARKRQELNIHSSAQLLSIRLFITNPSGTLERNQ